MYAPKQDVRNHVQPPIGMMGCLQYPYEPFRLADQAPVAVNNPNLRLDGRMFSLQEPATEMIPI